MGQLEGPEFYNDSHWMGEINYSPPWKRQKFTSVQSWIPRFRSIAKVMTPVEEVLDLGCGNGVLAAFLWHNVGHRARYVGVDFSKGPIRDAKKGNKKEGHKMAEFYLRKVEDVAKILSKHWKDDVRPTVVCTEVLEHVKDDLAIVKAIPSGTRCVFTVPHFDAPSHVRWFPEVKDVHNRYEKFFVPGTFSVERFYSHGPRNSMKFDNRVMGIKK